VKVVPSKVKKVTGVAKTPGLVATNTSPFGNKAHGASAMSLPLGKSDVGAQVRVEKLKIEL
jgi:hypothetical protein